MDHWKSRVLWPVAMLCLSGCVSVDATADHDATARYIEAATGVPAGYRPGDDPAARGRVRELLDRGLTVREAMEVALLHNRELQAAFHRVTAARADLVAAGVVSNPSLDGVLRFPEGGGLANLELGLSQSLSDLWLRPTRKRAATHALEREILEVAALATGVARDTQRAFHASQAAAEQVRVARENLDTVRQIHELARALQQAGSGTGVDVNTASAESVEQELALRTAELAAFEARARLATLLGLTGSPSALVLDGDLPPTPATWPPDPRALLDSARDHRLDVRSAQRAVAVARERVAEARRQFLRNVEAGVSFERDARPAGADDGKVLGPTLSLELPIFHQNQAGIARAEAELGAAEKTLEALHVRTDQEVRVALARASNAVAALRFYEEQLLPHREQSLELARRSYELEQGSFPLVFETQRALLSARVDHVRTRARLAASLTELERVTGQPLAELLPAPPPEPDTDDDGNEDESDDPQGDAS